MKTSMSFASFVVTIGILGLGAADSGFAASHGSSGSSRMSSGHSMSGSSRGQMGGSSHSVNKQESFKHDDRYSRFDYGRYYGYYPWNFCYSNYCYPCYRPCYQPCYAPSCCEYAPPCQEYCPPAPCEEPPCEQPPCETYCPPPCYPTCYPSCPEYCSSYGYPSYYGRYWWDRDRDHDKHREHPPTKEPTKTSGTVHKGSTGMGSMKVAHSTGGMSSGSHGTRR